MRTFPGFNEAGKPCPVCNTKEDKECCLIPIPDTKDGSIVECLAVHIDCIELAAMIKNGEKDDDIMFYQFVTKEKNKNG